VARILIVEDESMERLILRIILAGAGHELYFAENGEQALEIYVKESIHVVITDLLMPHVGGVELISVLKRLFPDAVVIAISGKGREELSRAQFAGAAATLAKPVEPVEILEVIEKVIAQGPEIEPAAEDDPLGITEHQSKSSLDGDPSVK